MKIVADPEFALYDNFFGVSSYSSYLDCKIIAIPQKYDFKPYGFGFQSNSPYIGPFNFFIKQMIEKGSMKNIVEKHQNKPQVCPDFSGKPMGFNNCFMGKTNCKNISCVMATKVIELLAIYI